MYNCEDIFEKTDAYLDGELSEIEYAEFEEHLKNCEACRNSVEFAKKMNSVMQGMPSVEPPADFLDNLHKKIAAEKKIVRIYKKWQPYCALAACLVLAIVIRTNAVKDLNESSSYLKMPTPEPTAAEALNASSTDTAAEETASVQRSAEPQAAVLHEVMPTAVPTEEATLPKTAELIPPAPTAEVKESVQPINDNVQMPESTAEATSEAEPIADVPMMFSLSEENTVAETTVQLPAEDNIVSDKTESLHVGGSVTTTEDEIVDSSTLPAPAAASAKRVSGSSSSTSSGGGGGASSNGTWIPGIAGANTPSMVNYISSEHKSEVEALIASLGIQKNGTVYTASKAVFEQFVSALDDKDILFDGIFEADGDNVQFVIEWE